MTDIPISSNRHAPSPPVPSRGLAALLYLFDPMALRCQVYGAFLRDMGFEVSISKLYHPALRFSPRHLADSLVRTLKEGLRLVRCRPILLIVTNSDIVTIFLAGTVKLLSGAKVVYDVIDLPFPFGNRPGAEKFAALVGSTFLFADGLLSHGRSKIDRLRDGIRRSPGGPHDSRRVIYFPTVIPCEIKLPDRDSARRTLSLDSETVLGFCGNIFTDTRGIDISGFSSMLRAFNEVHRRRPASKLLLCGVESDNPLLCQLISRFVEADHQAGIVALGKFRFGDSTHLSFLAAVDILILPGDSNPRINFVDRMKTAEYLLAGKPIIAWETDEVSRVFENEVDALILPMDQELRMSDLVERLVMDRDLEARLSAGALRKLIKERIPEVYRVPFRDLVVAVLSRKTQERSTDLRV